MALVRSRFGLETDPCGGVLTPSVTSGSCQWWPDIFGLKVELNVITWLGFGIPFLTLSALSEVDDQMHLFCTPSGVLLLVSKLL